jgi:hypothetical protein
LFFLILTNPHKPLRRYFCLSCARLLGIVQMFVVLLFVFQSRSSCICCKNICLAWILVPNQGLLLPSGWVKLAMIDKRERVKFFSFKPKGLN